MRHLRPHRTAAIVLALLVAAAVGASVTASHVVRDNEEQLLHDRTGEVRSLLESIGTTYEAQMASVAAIAQVTDGDVIQFRTAVEGVDSRAATAAEGGWGLLRRTPAGYVSEAVVGAPTAAADLPPEWTAGLDEAAAGHFTVLGVMGSGMARRLGMASGRPGIGGDVVVYNESSLVGAAASSAGGEDSPIVGVAMALYVGTEADPTQLVLGIGKVTGHVERAVVDISGAKVFLEVSATEPLGDPLATHLPGLLLATGVLLGLSIASVVELSQRRRDDALSTVTDLERQNCLLDQALSDQQAAEAARSALEDELRQAQRLEAVGQLAGGVAHDFNNVLAVILSYADLATDTATDPRTVADLESIQSAARSGAGLTRQLLQFSRQGEREASIVDVNERILDMVKMLDRTLGEDITLHTALSAGRAPILTDAVELDQVILNLVVNARDAVGRGGSISIGTEVVELDPVDLVHLPTLAPGPHLRLTIRDDGRGMEPDVLARAFEPFFTTKGRGQGTGLGLSTVYGIVQRQGGHVIARSTPGAGTTVEVLLPLVIPAAAGTTASAMPNGADPVDLARPSRASGTVGGRTVLVVEDEEPLRRATRRMLERAGFAVLDAHDGSSALHRHLHADIDLLLTDIVMPGGLSGVDVADGFRVRSPDLPVVFMTGYSDDILDRAQLDGSTPTAVLSKPFSEADLLEVLDAVIGAADAPA
jgi:signal transduction histidine kinase